MTNRSLSYEQLKNLIAMGGNAVQDLGLPWCEGAEIELNMGHEDWMPLGNEDPPSFFHPRNRYRIAPKLTVKWKAWDRYGAGLSPNCDDKISARCRAVGDYGETPVYYTKTTFTGDNPIPTVEVVEP